ncbi:peptidylprolyl isomerase [Roseomonas marmotae]|uniref:Parvulin-like PPIase n=1 Tax=Roseomonas marmotae TaxID=2768161 RepID=A0ABS3KAD6_9PROT|nr:peptidylprolyl isomerase [Roseomonas marmotae]MBO1074392.1 peptidyl-prolyl cis-trans isomerase [Roseomonas marmotae]QTI78134.1 peptidyl-prolyl cis-trans isomerase [Roseomonas marmotae]
MLTALRRLAGTWLAKALFLLLILSFGIWGIEDVVRNFGTDHAVARVNGDPVELPEAQTATRREIARIQRQLGSGFDITPQISEGVARRAVESLIMDRVQRQEAARLGVVAPDQALQEYVWSIPAFHGSDGRFSRALLDNFLRNNGLTEPEFLALLQADLQRQQMIGAVRSGAAGPDAMTKPLLKWQQERRVADVVTLPLADAREPAAPDEAQLRRYHENNPDRFSAPEYRRLVLATLSPAVVASEIQPTEEELHAAFEARRAQFETPERREIEQAVMPSREAAEAIARQWRDGASFASIEEAAQAAGGQAINLGSLDRAALPVPALADAAFSLPADGVSEPVQTAFGWHVLKVTGIEPGHARSFDEVRPELTAELVREKAADLAYERANEVEDALGGGATLEEAAQRFGLPLSRLTIDSRGLTQDGTPADLHLSSAGRDAALQAIFAAEPGQAPRLAEAGQSGLFAFELQEVIPATLKAFEAVEPEVRAAWMQDARRRSQEERAAALLSAVKGGKSLPEAAREAGLEARRVGPFPRQPDAQGDGRNSPPPELLERLFTVPSNDATMAETADGFAIGQPMEILRVDPDADPLGLGRVRTEVEQAMLGDLEAQYLEALRRSADVTLNPTMMGQVTAR